ncbi:MAG: hypothetical protein ACI9WU_003276 [Myxococcota bacterium]|jgi:hypothetical protein
MIASIGMSTLDLDAIFQGTGAAVAAVVALIVIVGLEPWSVMARWVRRPARRKASGGVFAAHAQNLEESWSAIHVERTESHYAERRTPAEAAGALVAAGGPERAAAVLEKQGDHGGAAYLYDEAGMKDRAGEQWRLAGAPGPARVIFEDGLV